MKPDIQSWLPNLESKDSGGETEEGHATSEDVGGVASLGGSSGSSRGSRLGGRLSGVGGGLGGTSLGGIRLSGGSSSGAVLVGGGAGSLLDGGLDGRGDGGGDLVSGISSTGGTGAAVDGLPVVVGDALLDTGGVLLGVGSGAIALVTVGGTLGGLLDITLVRRGDRDAVRLALDITSLTGVEALSLGLLSGGDTGGLALGSGHGGESAGNEDGGETHVDGFEGGWY
jgi:hypothetical protein